MSLTFYLDKGASLDPEAPCLTLDGKSLTFPTPHATNKPLTVGTGRQMFCPLRLSATGSVAPNCRPSSVATSAETTVERTSTPGATTFRSGPRCEKSAIFEVESIAPTAMTVGYAAG